MKKGLLFLTTLLISLTFKSQVTVTNVAPFNSAPNLVNNVLLGLGVTATNITFTGNPAQLGFFSGGLNGAPNLGIDSGIVMSTGDVNDIPAGGNQPSIGQYSGPGDVDLLSIAQSVTSNPASGNITTTQDAAFLEFDFTPSGDSVSFNFVFASEEYPQNGVGGFVNDVFNDVFAFFVSGPGITGTFASPAAFPNGAVNVAFVPGTTTPITISTIYVDPSQTPPFLNPQFYVDNTIEQNNDFNGFTIPITISFPVICGGTYHFKIAIADVEDDFLDTGVFLEGASFSSEAIQVNVVAATGDSTVIEGCAEADIVFTRPDTVGPLTVNFVIGGTAINGTDYNLIADSITFPNGVDTASLNINSIADGIVEGQETITITVSSINACGDTVISTGTIYILDLPDMIISSNDTNLTCQTATVPISVQASNALEPFSYVWTDSGGNPIGTNNDTIQVSGLVTDTFYVSVTDSCNLVTLNDTIIVSTSFNPPVIDSTTVDSLINCGESISLEAFMIPGTGTAPLSFSWNGIIGNPTTPMSPTTDSTFYVTVTDFCGLTATDSVLITIDTIPVLITSHSNDTTINCGESISLQATATNGAFTPQFSWNGTISNPLLVFPTTATTYILEAIGSCGANAFDTVNVIVDTIPIVINLSNDTTLTCPNETINLSVSPADGVSPYTYNWAPGGVGPNINVSPTQNTTYVVTATNGVCGSITDSVNVIVNYTPVALNITNDVTFSCPNITYPLQVVATPINGTAPYTYDWGVTSIDTNNIIDISVNTAQTISVTVTDFCGIEATDSMNVLFAPYTPLSIITDPVDSTCANENVNLSAIAFDGVAPYSLTWSNGGIGSPTIYSSAIAGENIVTVTVTDECLLQESVDMIVDIINCEVDVVTVITPNGDNVNDLLIFRSLNNFPNNHLTVLNRWGKTIFEKDNYKNDWDGGDLSEGTYFYVLELNNSENTIHKGTFTLLK